MFKLLLSSVAASEVCEKHAAEMGMELENCEAAHQEFINMVDSGKTIAELEADLQQCSGSGAQQLPDPTYTSPADVDMACNGVCKNMGDQPCGQCIKIRQMASNCQLDTPGCARQVAYGGYVKSHVLIQCYGIIQEGCQRLPTKYMPSQVSMQGQGQVNTNDQWPSCKELCSAGCSGNSCGNCACQGKQFVEQPMMNQNSCNTTQCGCMKNQAQQYLRCIGRRVSKCYRQKWTTTRTCETGTPTEWGGCTQSWNQKYNCAGCNSESEGEGCAGCR